MVTSGSVGAGRELCSVDESRNTLASHQILASVGQARLIQIYADAFRKHKTTVAQILLTRGDFGLRKSYLNIRNTLENLLKYKIVPIVNENDTTAIQELAFGDNDQLAAYVSHYFDADLLTILTDIDGYYDTNPHIDKNAKLQKQVTTISQDELNAVDTANSEFATGGIVTKLKAADFLLNKNKKSSKKGAKGIKKLAFQL